LNEQLQTKRIQPAELPEDQRRQLTGHRLFDSYFPAAVVVVLAAIVRCFVWLDADVSWLLTFAEQSLTDTHLYLNYNEINPPACLLIYLPAILIGRFVAISPESVVTSLVFVGALLCLWIVGRTLAERGARPLRGKPALVAVACATLLILPGDNFAEREHVALIAILPLLAVYAKRVTGATVGRSLAIVAGMGGAFAVAIKPHFVLPVAFPLAYAAWCLRAQRTKLVSLFLSPEHFAAAIALFAYGLLIVRLFPDFIQYTVPLALTIYVPLRISPTLLIENASVILCAASVLASCALATTDIQRRCICIGNLAAVGFAVALIIEGKGWPYQGYPAVALSILMLSVVLADRLALTVGSRGAGFSPERALELLSVILFSVIYTLASLWFLDQPDRSPLLGAVSRLVPVSHPKIISITGGPGIAFPLTRKLQGASMGHEPWQTVSVYGGLLLSSRDLNPQARRKIEEYLRLDRAQLTETIGTKRPDVILFGGSALELWAFSHPEIATVLRPYYRAKIVEGVAIWLPRKPPAHIP